MDVTSLLNAASAVQREAVARLEGVDTMDRHSDTSTEEEARYSSSIHTSPSEKSSSQRVSESKVPSRSRTPWDADGYALPLMVDTKSAPAPVQPLVCSESPKESSSPKSPRHKCSDSHSSLSSYASSSTSLSHSRLSSMSTVGGVKPMSIIPDVSSLAIGSECFDLPKDFSLRQRREGVLSPPLIIEEIQAHGTNRFSSPSDAVLLSKLPRGLERFEAQRFHEKRPRPDFSLLVPPELSKVHKRTVSAPSFAPVQSFDRTFPPFLSNYRPSISLSTSIAVSQTHGVMDNPTTPSSASNGSLDQGQVSQGHTHSLRCMYSADCDTGSQLRKVVSHIFGRNKSCTRQIPASCWVHYCRKHYQRSRYRNAHEFVKLQAELIWQQICNVHDWSEQNKLHQRPGVVQGWVLTMRKREAARLQDKVKKRPYHDDSDDNDDDNDDDDPFDPALQRGTAVPAWLQEKCGENYSTDEILAIVTQLQEEIKEKKMTQIPDIEILPTLSADDSDESKPKAATKRKSSYPKQHKKAQSVNVAMSRPSVQQSTQQSTQQSAQQSDSQQAQPQTYWQGDLPSSGPYAKRQCLSNMPTYGNYHDASTSPSLASPGMSNMPMYGAPPNGTPLPSLTSTGMSSSTAPLPFSSQLPFRPGPSALLPQAQARRAEDVFSERRPSQMSQNNYGVPSRMPPPQRFNSATPMPQTPANSSSVGHNAHHRSASQFGGMPQVPSSSTFNFDMGTPATHPSTYTELAAVSSGNHQSIASNGTRQGIPTSNAFGPMGMMSRPSYMAAGHSRHQSTPAVSHPPTTRSTPGYNHNTLYGFNGGYSTPPMRNYQPQGMNSFSPHPITEPGLFCDPSPYHDTQRPSTRSGQYHASPPIQENQTPSVQSGQYGAPGFVQQPRPSAAQMGQYGTPASVHQTQASGTQASQNDPSSSGQETRQTNELYNARR
ncbi:hypothetical protein F5Y18DRAFT_218193 [Xylariaceae sp. FL1019]|nr:hypothetical protein F5Y18DRAFT_218193 [Xylariaceae sp. FL1019]